MSRTRRSLALLLAWLVSASGLGAATQVFNGAGLDEHLGALLPDDLPLLTSLGQPTTLGALRAGGPLLLVPAYYRCPMLCGLVISGVAQAIDQLGWTPGERFRVATVSFDAQDTPQDARRAQATALGLIAHQRVAPAAWPFTVGDDAAVQRLLGCIGMRISRDPVSGQIAHPAVVVVVATDGRISRYLLGIGVPERQLRLALLDAGANRTATVSDAALLFCYHYDPAAHRYGFAVQNGMRIGALGAALLAASVIGYCSWRRQPTRRGAP